MVILPEQVRATRALLRLEAADGLERVAPATLDKLRRVLEAKGAECIEDGVRRRPQASAETEALYQELLTISLEGAEALAGHALLTDDDLYDENGLPA